jgi:hypothetical protein
VTVKIIASFTKPGAIFLDADSAQSDRKSLFSDDLKTRMSTAYRILKESGIVLSGPDVFWNQETATLTIIRVITNYDDYKTLYSQVIGTVHREISQASDSAGWRQIGHDVVNVE